MTQTKYKNQAFLSKRDASLFEEFFIDEFERPWQVREPYIGRLLSHIIYNLDLNHDFKITNEDFQKIVGITAWNMRTAKEILKKHGIISCSYNNWTRVSTYHFNAEIYLKFILSKAEKIIGKRTDLSIIFPTSSLAELNLVETKMTPSPGILRDTENKLAYARYIYYFNNNNYIYIYLKPYNPFLKKNDSSVKKLPTIKKISEPPMETLHRLGEPLQGWMKQGADYRQYVDELPVSEAERRYRLTLAPPIYPRKKEKKPFKHRTRIEFKDIEEIPEKWRLYAISEGVSSAYVDRLWGMFCEFWVEKCWGDGRRIVRSLKRWFVWFARYVKMFYRMYLGETKGIPVFIDKFKSGFLKGIHQKGEIEAYVDRRNFTPEMHRMCSLMGRQEWNFWFKNTTWVRKENHLTIFWSDRNDGWKAEKICELWSDELKEIFNTRNVNKKTQWQSIDLEFYNKPIVVDGVVLPENSDHLSLYLRTDPVRYQRYLKDFPYDENGKFKFESFGECGDRVEVLLKNKEQADHIAFFSEDILNGLFCLDPTVSYQKRVEGCRVIISKVTDEEEEKLKNFDWGAIARNVIKNKDAPTFDYSFYKNNM